ncbi:MAG TPA: heparinase II/III family protein [Vicinamibacterales bacterium]|nr:heparinase II/III family protein [Vicinamibacterales bacterium]
MRSAAWGALVLAMAGLTTTHGALHGQAPNAPTLAADWPAATLQGVILARDAWRPVPPVGDRDAWVRLPPGLRARIVARAERAVKDPIPPLPATLFLDYTRAGDRGRFESAMFARRDRLHALVIAECVEDAGRFLDAIVDTAWAIAEESSWTVPAHQGAQQATGGLPDTAEPVVDLFSAQTAHSLAWTHYLLGDRLDTVSPLVRPRLTREIERRVLAPYEARHDWWWMGFAPRSSRPNNWNPWINSNVLAAALLVEPDAARRAQLVQKVLRSLDTFLGPHPGDGSCDEGPAYWGRAGASLFESLELLKSATAGRIDYFANPVIADIGRFIYRARIADTWFVNVGDSGARVSIDRGLVFRYGKAVGDPLLRAMGASGATEAAFDLNDRSIGRTWFALCGWEALAAERDAAPPLPRDVWLPHEDMQLMAARDRGGSSEGLYVAAWGSHNAQSHNHNDVGNVVVFVDGSPVLVDVGRPTYTSQTFSNTRYEIWAMQSAFHNLPTVNGQMQKDGAAYRAKNVVYQARDNSATLMMDIAPAYPAEAGIREWTRLAGLERGRQAVISDAFVMTAPTRAMSMNLMTPCEASETEPGTLRLGCGRIGGKPGLVVFARFNARIQQAAVERIDLDDRSLISSWGDHLNRIVLTPREAVQQGSWKVTIAK